MYESRMPTSFTMLLLHHQEELVALSSCSYRCELTSTTWRQTRNATTVARLHEHDKQTLCVTYEAITSDSPRLISLLPNELRMHPRKTARSRNERSKWQRHYRDTSTGRMPRFWTVAWCSA